SAYEMVRCIGGSEMCIRVMWTTIIVALFIAEAVVFTVRANSTCFQEQVQEYVIEKASTHALQTGAIVSGMPTFDCCGEVEEIVCPDAQPENF
ncbi:MAG: hypothetical protein K2I35_08540, partial [Duncaniella sp.]|nr:hypothetical protein [Duncaniella sp.]